MYLDALHLGKFSVLMTVVTLLLSNSTFAIPTSDGDVQSNSTSSTSLLSKNESFVGADDSPTCVKPASDPNWVDLTPGASKGQLEGHCRSAIWRLLAETPKGDSVYFYDVRRPPPERIGPPYIVTKAVPYGGTYASCTIIVAFRSQWVEGLIPHEVEGWKSLPLITVSNAEAIRRAYLEVNSWCIAHITCQPGWVPVADMYPQQALAVYVVPTNSTVRKKSRVTVRNNDDDLRGGMWSELNGNETIVEGATS